MKISHILAIIFLCLVSVSTVTADDWHVVGCPGCKQIWDLEWSPDGRFLASGASDGVWLYDAETLQETARFSSISALQIAWSFDSTMLASAAADMYETSVNEAQLYIWDVDSKTIIRDLPLVTDHVDFDWSPTENVLAYGSGSAMKLWDANTDVINTTERLTPTDMRDPSGYHLGTVWCISWSPRGDKIAVSTPQDILIWSVTSEQVTTTISANAYIDGTMSWDPNGEKLLIGRGSLADTPVVADIATGEVRKIYPFEPDTTPYYFSSTADWSPNGRWAVMNEVVEPYVYIWDTSTWKIVADLTHVSNFDQFVAVAWSPDSRRVAGATARGYLYVWEMTD